MNWLFILEKKIWIKQLIKSKIKDTWQTLDSFDYCP